VVKQCRFGRAENGLEHDRKKDWDLSVDSFLKSSFNCIRHAAPLMRERKWGRIINTTSTAWLGTVGHCNYGAAKAGIVGLTRAVAREMGRSGVTCNAYAPTAGTRFTLSADIKAGFQKRFDSGLITKERFEELMHRQRLKHWLLLSFICVLTKPEILTARFSMSLILIFPFTQNRSRPKRLPRKTGIVYG